MYLLDTNICIFLIKNKNIYLKKKIFNCEKEELFLSFITIAELEYGVAKSKFREKNRQALLDFCSDFTSIVGFTTEDTETYGMIRAYLENKGIPGFVVVKESSSTDFGIIDLKNISFIYSSSSFIEKETVPPDSKNLGYTWKYCNKNGSPDRRYANNYQIPIQQYGEITISSSEGLNEEFMISNSDATDLFTTNLYNFIALLNKMNWNAQIIEDKA